MPNMQGKLQNHARNDKKQQQQPTTTVQTLPESQSQSQAQAETQEEGEEEEVEGGEAEGEEQADHVVADMAAKQTAMTRPSLRRATEMTLTAVMGLLLGYLAAEWQVPRPPGMADGHQRSRPTPAEDIWQPRTDLYRRPAVGDPGGDLPAGGPPRVLAAFAVGIRQLAMLNATVSRFPAANFTLLLFHYDGHAGDPRWQLFPWARHAIHVAARGQTKWWFAKRFLHPAVVAPYDYVFLWDDDLLPGHGFGADGYVHVARRHGLDVSQPAMGPGSRGVTWRMTLRRGDGDGDGGDVHRSAPPGENCHEGPDRPPCAAFVEIMAPVFSRRAWRCTWNMIQNDLVHSWGLDFALHRCVPPPARQRIGVVDKHWVVHPGVLSLGRPDADAGTGTNQSAWADQRNAVRARCHVEWGIFNSRLWAQPQINATNSR